MLTRNGGGYGYWALPHIILLLPRLVLLLLQLPSTETPVALCTIYVHINYH